MKLKSINRKFVFDVDGTLTPSREKINDKFLKVFHEFCLKKNVYLVTGSDKPKTVEQVTKLIYNKCVRVYNCSGSDVYEQDKCVYRSDWLLPHECEVWLEDVLRESPYRKRTGNHIELRPGMVNFSVIGRNANIPDRKQYYQWDQKSQERIIIARDFEKQFPNLSAKVGGETGIDIFPKGNDKSQILRDFSGYDDIHFFGDRMDEQGNDYPLSHALEKKNFKHTLYNIKDWHETMKIIECLE